MVTNDWMVNRGFGIGGLGKLVKSRGALPSILTSISDQHKESDDLKYSLAELPDFAYY